MKRYRHKDGFLEEFNERVRTDWVRRSTPPCNPCVVSE